MPTDNTDAERLKRALDAYNAPPEPKPAAKPRPRGSTANRPQPQQPAPGKSGLTVSKKLAVWAVIVATVDLVVSYTLAALALYTNETLSGIVFSTCVGFLVTYAGKSAFEKHSRNKYKVDENGVPWGGDKAG